MSDKALGQLIKHCRQQAGLSQRELSASVSRDRSWLAHVEQGDYRPSAAQLWHLADSLGMAATALLRHLDGETASEGGRAHISRRTARQFACSWKSGYKAGWDEPAGDYEQAAVRQLQSFLNTRVADLKIRSKLLLLGLGCWEAACAALLMLERGAQWCRLALAQIGFPRAVHDGDNCCVNHLPRLCLVCADTKHSLVLLGEYYGSAPRYLPPILAWTDSFRRKYLLLEGERRGCALVGNSDDLRSSQFQPQLLTLQESLRHRCALQRLILRGVSEAAIKQWLSDWLAGAFSDSC